MDAQSSNRIKTEDAVQFFEGKANLAREFDITPQAITSWGEFVPELREYQLRARYPEAFPAQAA